jgi:hypothetical protein
MADYYAHNVELIAYHDLEEKPGFKLAMQEVDGRFYLYTGQFWTCGWTILDVTDPAQPRTPAVIDGPGNTMTLQVQVADRKLIASLEVLPGLAPFHHIDLSQPSEEGIYVFDVTQPSSPRKLSHFVTGGTGTHRNHYDGGRFVYLAAGMPGFEGNILVIVDIADPTRPVEAARWFLPEQYVAGGARPDRRYSLHGPAYTQGDRAYLPYGQGGMVILDIADPCRPKLVSRTDFGVGPSLGGGLGMHTVIPLPERKLAIVNTEATAELSQEPMNLAGIVDILDETQPRLIAQFPTPVPPPEAPYPNFQQRGGRFGPHNQHHFNNQACLLNDDQHVYLTWFNAGLRVYDIRDPYLPREVGSFVPPQPTKRHSGLPRTALVSQTEDVLVDRRGYAYITDKNQGVYVVRYTGG